MPNGLFAFRESACAVDSEQHDCAIMSMIGCFYALRDEDLEAIVQKPKRIAKLWATPKSEPPAKLSFFSKLFGAKPPPKEEDADPWTPTEKAEYFDVDKAWHGVHYLLTGSAWEGHGSLAFVLRGGRSIKEDLGYGPPHGFTSAEVKAIDTALQGINPEELYAKADPEDLASKEIYPTVWQDEPKEECIGYVIEHLKGLKDFVAKTAQTNRALIAHLG